MLISLEWLGDHVDLQGLDPQQVAERLTLHVAEVKGVRDPSRDWEGIVVGAVRAVRPHPNADRLRLVTVEAAQGEVEVVCGASNVAVGQRICYAPEGVTLPGGMLLKRRKIRGVESSGMVLSERELGLGQDHDGILVLEPEAEPGRPLHEVLAGGARIDLDNTAITTRPDLWGHYGLARELAAVLERDLRPLELGDPLGSQPPQVEVAVEAPDLCPRYLGWVLGGITVEPSPDWLRRRLELAGQRPINNIVDLTNYVQLECGQPLHAFDRRQIASDRIVVRRSGDGEQVTTLDGSRHTLAEGRCLIADPERAVAIAGVMGLANSEVLEQTTEIILEAANFEMTSIRATSKRLGLRTDSAVRFEKGLDPAGVPIAARRFFTLLKRICPAARPLGGPCDVAVEAPAPPRIEVRQGWIADRLGVALGAGKVDSILVRLGFGVERAQGKLVVTVPSWRAGRDVRLPEDLLEEVGRIHGYDRIEPVALRAALEPVPIEPERAARERLRQALSSVSGFTELHLYPFTTAEDCRRARVDAGSLGVVAAEQPGLDLLAPSHLPNLLRAVANNQKHHEEVSVYVVAPVFSAAAEGALPVQEERVGVACRMSAGTDAIDRIRSAVQHLLEAFFLRGVEIEQQEGPAWLHPGRSACLRRGREAFGWFGQIHPGVARAFEVDANTALADLEVVRLRTAAGRIGRMRPVSRYPSVPYDVAVLVDRRTPAAEVAAVLRRVDAKLVREVRLFDDYEGANLPEGKRSLAFAIVFGSHERTLQGAEIERLRGAVSSAIQKRGWTLRV